VVIELWTTRRPVDIRRVLSSGSGNGRPDQLVAAALAAAGAAEGDEELEDEELGDDSAFAAPEDSLLFDEESEDEPDEPLSELPARLSVR
jgi:hypothetical protein